MDFKKPDWDWQPAYEAAEAAGDDRPTWAYDWPAGQRLASDLKHMQLPSRCADLGCGRGLLGMTAHRWECKFFCRR